MKTKKRKKRDTSYSKAWKVVDEHGIAKVREIWEKRGMYSAGYELNTSPYTIRYLAHKHGWKKPASTCPHLVKAVKRGNANPEYYKNLDFSEVEINHKPINKGGKDE